MGGKRGVLHYMQRTAIQGSPTTISKITNVYQQHGKQHETEIHPFRQHFEDLKVGDTLITAKHTVTETDITNFANVSGDNFYAHMDATSLEGTIFEQRVAHGYFVLSKAAGLFSKQRFSTSQFPKSSNSLIPQFLRVVLRLGPAYLSLLNNVGKDMRNHPRPSLSHPQPAPLK